MPKAAKKPKRKAEAPKPKRRKGVKPKTQALAPGDVVLGEWPDALKALAESVRADGGAHGDLPPGVNEAIDEVLDELDTLDKDLTNEFGSGADDPTAVQNGLAEWKRWRTRKRRRKSK